MTGILILGGYGNFGKRIAASLTRHGVPVIIAGRHREKAEDLARTLPSHLVSIAAFDATRELSDQLSTLRPIAVINTCGPFQTQGFRIARLCILHGVHYIDLADGRDFVIGMTSLDEKAKRATVAVISGASTVPGLSSAVLDHFRADFASMESLRYGISPGQQAERGLATTQGILSYVGQKLKPFIGQRAPAYGWQDVYAQAYPELGKRWMANCDIPDLDLLPTRYGLRHIQFSAGLELAWMHLGLWLFSWLVRLGAPLHLPNHANLLLRISNAFNRFGTAHGGMHVILQGRDHSAQPLEAQWFIIAKDGDGPNIPCVPAILLAKRLFEGKLLPAGAYPCVGLITLDDYLHELSHLNIQTFTDKKIRSHA